MPSDWIDGCVPAISGTVAVPSGSVSCIPGSAPRGSCPHSCTRERSLSCAMVSLNIMANVETMSAFRCRIANEGEIEVRSSEKHVSLFVWRRPEEDVVVILWSVGRVG